MTHRPAVVAFDVIGTLMSLEPLRERLIETGQSAHLLEAWYTRTLRDGMALSATGDFAPFTDVAEAALRGITSYSISDEQVAHVMAGFSDLPAFPDALPAMTALTEAGVRVACLTNGSAYLTSSFVNRAGLGSLVDRVVTVGEVYRWKPSKVVYLYAAEVLDVPADGARRGARLGLSRRQAGRSRHRLGEPQVRRLRRAVRAARRGGRGPGRGRRQAARPGSMSPAPCVKRHRCSIDVVLTTWMLCRCRCPGPGRAHRCHRSPASRRKRH
jgi:2-haloacid dehalogenase